MSKEQTKDLLLFLNPFSDKTVEMVIWLREMVWDAYPETNELIYDNYNAVAVGWSPTDKIGHIFCSIAVGRTSHNIHFGFYNGNVLSDPEKLLLGKGNQYRYILVTDKNSFPKPYITGLMQEAYVNAVAKVKDPKQFRQGETIVKSISEKKREKKSK